MLLSFLFFTQYIISTTYYCYCCCNSGQGKWGGVSIIWWLLLVFHLNWIELNSQLNSLLSMRKKVFNFFHVVIISCFYIYTISLMIYCYHYPAPLTAAAIFNSNKKMIKIDLHVVLNGQQSNLLELELTLITRVILNHLN